ncbi:Dual specificity protein kinase pom1 [Yarrowia sp. C11]|nr:Dual specificity protein kinase pom1 [Yarrowia sp. E02]KAG5369165.1 Dual specificity protein kinase pom1 [Yarrowia sp. C11]
MSMSMAELSSMDLTDASLFQCDDPDTPKGSIRRQRSRKSLIPRTPSFHSLIVDQEEGQTSQNQATQHQAQHTAQPTTQHTTHHTTQQQNPQPMSLPHQHSPVGAKKSSSGMVATPPIPTNNSDHSTPSYIPQSISSRSLKSILAPTVPTNNTSNNQNHNPLAEKGSTYKPRPKLRSVSSGSALKPRDSRELREAQMDERRKTGGLDLAEASKRPPLASLTAKKPRTTVPMSVDPLSGRLKRVSDGDKHKRVSAGDKVEEKRVSTSLSHRLSTAERANVRSEREREREQERERVRLEREQERRRSRQERSRSSGFADRAADRAADKSVSDRSISERTPSQRSSISRRSSITPSQRSSITSPPSSNRSERISSTRRTLGGTTKTIPVQVPSHTRQRSVDRVERGEREIRPLALASVLQQRAKPAPAPLSIGTAGVATSTPTESASSTGVTAPVDAATPTTATMPTASAGNARVSSRASNSRAGTSSAVPMSAPSRRSTSHTPVTAPLKIRPKPTSERRFISHGNDKAKLAPLHVKPLSGGQGLVSGPYKYPRVGPGAPGIGATATGSPIRPEHRSHSGSPVTNVPGHMGHPGSGMSGHLGSAMPHHGGAMPGNMPPNAMPHPGSAMGHVSGHGNSGPGNPLGMSMNMGSNTSLNSVHSMHSMHPLPSMPGSQHGSPRNSPIMNMSSSPINSMPPPGMPHSMGPHRDSSRSPHHFFPPPIPPPHRIGYSLPGSPVRPCPPVSASPDLDCSRSLNSAQSMKSGNRNIPSPGMGGNVGVSMGPPNLRGKSYKPIGDASNCSSPLATCFPTRQQVASPVFGVDTVAVAQEMKKLTISKHDSPIESREKLQASLRTPSTVARLNGKCMTPSEAKARFPLVGFEKTEIASYKHVFYYYPFSNNHEAHSSTTDDSEGNLRLAAGDHIAYRYQVIKLLGKGSFGVVAQCYDHKHGCHVAVKIVKNKKRFQQQAAVEANFVESLTAKDPDDVHHIVRYRDRVTFRGHLCIVTEMLFLNLYELIGFNKFRGFSLELVRHFAQQLLTSLAFLGSQNIVHCDLKPENILVSDYTKGGIKLIDFGSSCLENEKVYTYIQSRFYRSPEVILGADYNKAIDMWSFGCIIAELYTGMPIFSGENEQDQLVSIMQVQGFPQLRFLSRCSRKRLFFDTMGRPRPSIFVSPKGKTRVPNSTSLEHILGNGTCPSFLSFLRACLQWDPEDRLTAKKALRHEFIVGVGGTQKKD